MQQDNQSFAFYPGQRVITSHGLTAVVAWVGPRGDVWAYVPHGGLPRRVTVRGDAWGGEHDQAEGLAA